MAIEKLDDLVAWRLARELERRVFAFTEAAPVARDVEFCRQIRRSSSSSPRNLAEGFGRFWPAEFAHKVRIAIGELGETQDHLDKALEMKYVAETEHLEMYILADRAIGASVRFAEYLEAAGPDWKKDYLARKREYYRAKRATRRANALPIGEPQDPERVNRKPENAEPQNLAPQNPEPAEPGTEES